MNILKDQLLTHKSFLKLTSENTSKLENKLSVEDNDLLITLHDNGILSIEPKAAGNLDIIISSGIHGNETAPIEICDDLVNRILNGQVIVRNRVLFIIGNPPAMDQGERFIKENLNRLFCNKHAEVDHDEADRAATIEAVTRNFYTNSVKQSAGSKERCHFDLHTAIRTSKYEKFAIYPYQDGGQFNHRYINFFEHSKINTLLLAHQPSSTYSYFTSHEFNANAFTVELGQVKPFGENDMNAFSGIMDNLEALISGNYQWNEDSNHQTMNLFQVDDEVLRHSEANFSLNIDADFSNFTEFPIGFQLTTDDNDGYKFKQSGQAVVFPNAKVPTGQRVALIVSKTTT